MEKLLSQLIIVIASILQEIFINLANDDQYVLIKMKTLSQGKVWLLFMA